MKSNKDYYDKLTRQRYNHEYYMDHRHLKGRKTPRQLAEEIKEANRSKFIENNINKNVGIHYGDLGKARDTYYWNMSSSRRSTGHFGTGTYFLSEKGAKQDEEMPFFTRKDRPKKEIDFSKYNMLKVKDDIDADTLHSGLKAVNYNEYNDYNYDRLKIMLKRYNISDEKILKAELKAKEKANSLEYKNADYDSQLDSLSTIYMKELGFEGIDVRDVEGYDNTTYGSVIYDLNKKKQQMTTLYHSSNANFNEFNNEKADSAIIEGNYGPGHYFFDDKETSEGYGAFNKYHYEAEVDTSNFLHIKDDMGILGQKTYKEELNKRGYTGEQNKREFMLKQNIPGLIIEHQKPGFKKWNEYVVFDGKTIKIKNKKEM